MAKKKPAQLEREIKAALAEPPGDLDLAMARADHLAAELRKLGHDAKAFMQYGRATVGVDRTTHNTDPNKWLAHISFTPDGKLLPFANGQRGTPWRGGPSNAATLAAESWRPKPGTPKVMLDEQTSEPRQTSARMPTLDEVARAFSYIEHEYRGNLEKYKRIDMEQWAEGLAFGQTHGSADEVDKFQAKEALKQLTEAEWLRATERANSLLADQGESARYVKKGK